MSQNFLGFIPQNPRFITTTINATTARDTPEANVESKPLGCLIMQFSKEGELVVMDIERGCVSGRS